MFLCVSVVFLSVVFLENFSVGLRQLESDNSKLSKKGQRVGIYKSPLVFSREAAHGGPTYTLFSCGMVYFCTVWL